MTFSLDLRAHSEVGLVRKNNQDSGYASPTMIVVADGMGGAAAGDLASTVAVVEIAKADDEFRASPHTDDADPAAVLSAAVAQANDSIADLVASDHTLDGMGTTVCGATFDGERLGLVHIGDSRGYLMRGGSLKRLTHDHSWVQSLIDEGRITEEEAAVHPHRSLVLKVLNGHPNHVPDTEVVDLALGDRVLLCSDGLCGFTSDENIAEIMGTDDLDVVMADLIQAAHVGGGADNITIIVADVVAQDDALDAAAPLVIGAAETTEVPDIPEGAGVVDLGDDEPDGDDAIVPRAPRPVGAASDPEQDRYQPTLRRRRRWVPAVLALALVVVLGGALWGGWSWSRTQYYVGESQGKVAIFNGLEGSILGQKLHTVTEVTDIEVAGLPAFYRQQVNDTIRTSTLEAAQRTVSQLRNYAGSCSPRDPDPTPTPSTSASSSPSSSATPSGSSSGSPSGSGTPSGSASSMSPSGSASRSPSGPLSSGSASGTPGTPATPGTSMSASSASPSSSSSNGAPAEGDC